MNHQELITELNQFIGDGWLPGNFLQVLARFLLVPVAEVPVLLSSGEPPALEIAQALEELLKQIKAAGSFPAFLTKFHQSQQGLFPPAIDLPVLGSYDLQSGRVVLTEEEFKVVPDRWLYPRNRTAEEKDRYLTTLRERYGTGEEVDYWPVRTAKTDSAAVAVIETDDTVLWEKEPKARLRACRNQLYWSRFEELAYSRVRWYAVQHGEDHSLASRIAWFETHHGLGKWSAGVFPFRLNENHFNWLDWNIVNLRAFAAHLKPGSWRGRNLLLFSETMAVSADVVRTGNVEALRVLGRFCPFQPFPTGRKGELGLRINFSWRLPKDPTLDILLPDVVAMLRWLADWSCGGDIHAMRTFENWVINEILISLR